MADLRKGIVQYALRQNSDFDKYRALELIEGLKNAAILCKDKKADFYTTVHIKLLSYNHTMRFIGYDSIQTR